MTCLQIASVAANEIFGHYGTKPDQEPCLQTHDSFVSNATMQACNVGCRMRQVWEPD